MDDLLPIGRFARLSGLSVGALRHYDELDLLRPARTHPFTNYRLYRRDQLATARTIVRLRDLEINEANGSADWDIASAYEAMARAYLVAGDLEQVAVWKAKAVAALDGIADADDREIIEGDIETLP